MCFYGLISYGSLGHSPSGVEDDATASVEPGHEASPVSSAGISAILAAWDPPARRLPHCEVVRPPEGNTPQFRCAVVVDAAGLDIDSGREPRPSSRSSVGVVSAKVSWTMGSRIPIPGT